MLVCLWSHRVRYARLFMISSGGRGMTKFLFTHIFKERIKNNMQQSNGFRRQPPVLWRPFQRIRPLPHSMSDFGYARLFMISMGRRNMTKFLSTYVFKGRKKKLRNNQNPKNTRQSICSSGSFTGGLMGASWPGWWMWLNNSNAKLRIDQILLLLLWIS